MSRDETPQPSGGTDNRTSGSAVASPPRLAAAPTSSVSPALADHGSCMCAAAVGQGRLFDMDPTPIPIAWDWPAMTTDHTRRVGFWRRRTPDIFAVSHGVGPLLVMPDTNVLIDLHRNLDTVQGAAFLGDPTATTDWR